MLRWVKWAGPASNFSRAQQYLQTVYPNEVHGIGGHCQNPKCDYEFTPQDQEEIEFNGGWFTCPKCNYTQNVYAEEKRNKVGLSPDEMGNLGEQIVSRLGQIPGLGKITWVSNYARFPIDMIAGDYGVEVKTNHSEAQPRFKLGGGWPGQDKRQGTQEGKLQYCKQEGLRPALVGVRLNFYTDKADIFVRPDSFTDTWIGAPSLSHVATVDFTDLNPFKRPEDVPQNLPDDDNIPF
ncbi:MAG TPA: hypothetical protein VKE92_11610 [Anaerolineales bacterium]|nr:hypothetical protein [Anaerolineales bacterium]